MIEVQTRILFLYNILHYHSLKFELSVAREMAQVVEQLNSMHEPLSVIPRTTWTPFPKKLLELNPITINVLKDNEVEGLTG